MMGHPIEIREHRVATCASSIIYLHYLGIFGGVHVLGTCKQKLCRTSYPARAACSIEGDVYWGAPLLRVVCQRRRNT
jgi:hypothetical protein